MAFSTGGSTRRGQPAALSEINVTPLVDVMLVLLIVFMITAPMLAAGIKVDLPQSRAALPQNPKEPVIVTVSKDSKVTLGKIEVAVEALPAEIRKILAGDDRAIHLRGDRESSYGDVVAVLDTLAANGLTKVALLANARGARSGAGPAVVAGARAAVDGAPTGSTGP